MQRLIETLKEFGIEIPEDKQSEVKSALSKHYKNLAEHEKAIKKLETDRDTWKSKAETAEKTLKGFESVDLDTMKTELSNWKAKAENAEKEAQKQIYERDFSDALKAELENIKFTSEAAKRDVMSQIKAADLKLKEGKILGLNDLIDQIKKEDSSAFVDEQQQQLEDGKARFTDKKSSGDGAGFGKMTKKEIMDIKDATERQAAIAENSHLFIK